MKKLAVFVALLGLLLLPIVIWKTSSSSTLETEVAAKPLFQNEQLSFWLITDPHYIDEQLHDSGDAFQRIQATAAGKDLRYQKQSLQALVAKALVEKPQGLIVTGDITLNGERVSAEVFSELLQPLREAGINTFIIPGNHDIYDGWARRFEGTEQEKTEQISPTDFQHLFKDHGYDQAALRDDHSLSYLIQINEYYNFVFLDTNIYTVEPSKRDPVTAGKVKPETKDWLAEQLQAASQQGKRTLVFMHHNLFEHNSVVNKGYVLNNAEEIRSLLEDYQVPIVFSGHIHAQDILTDQETGITEIVTGSFSITPNPVGVIEIDQHGLRYTRNSVDVEQWAQQQSSTDEQLLAYRTYLSELFLKDSQSMGYRSLLEVGYREEEDLDRAAELIGELNLRFFTGEDDRSDQEATEIKESEAYRTISEESAFLKEYVDSILQDKNENDRSFDVTFN